MTDFNFEEGDRIDIGDAEIASFNVQGPNLAIYLESDLDVLFLLGVDAFDPGYFLD